MTICPHCQNKDERMLEDITTGPPHPTHPDWRVWLCHVCGKVFKCGV